MRLGIGEHFEGEGVQAVARQDRGRLVERLVDRRLAAAHVVVVHRRQIVMDQRINVDRLDRHRDLARAVAVDAEQVGGRAQQQGAQSLAATDRGMAHSLVEVGARIVGYSEQPVEACVDIRSDGGERLFERGRGRAGHRISRLQRGGCRQPCPRHPGGSPRSGPGLRRGDRRSAGAADRRVRKAGSIRRASLHRFRGG
ncbi:hypothetical protein WR25_27091 [Diploscapter pachys]|uniref:Uncharacterized protein n=1 Tax=Diploscapter pachys TaxID=2018661 RepID=A0A2A2K268_9BILA|nr:hypothetical protein WR25_27091 [Diploscapter pachys]